ncbi:MAG: phytanoyl-CoA dioxygenase family protein [Lentisphaeria bacterium]|nr:phytanoyl-CoA dioxygenase family protein [Lentisphaeria bacterium]NQZ68427.1 phytanoyl-CoA dioxygenase family protein [Lentisphaeria bacterium]
MIETTIGEYPDTISTEAVAHMDRENFLTYGKILTDQEIIDARFAYWRAFEQNPIAYQARKNPGVPATQAMEVSFFCQEPNLMKLIGNDYMLRIASAALHTAVEDLVYVGGFLHRHRLNIQWEHEDWFWDGWHQDAKPVLDPLQHCNLWMYLADVTRMEGATQGLIGGCELQRENLRNDKDPNEGTREMLDYINEHPDEGTWAEAPCGGGFAWGGHLFHRVCPNRSGLNRTLVTYEYAPRDSEHKDMAQSLGQEKLDMIKAALPEDKHYLICL